MQEERAQADTEQKTAMTELNHLLQETIRLNLNRGAAGVAGLDAVDDEALDVCAFMCVCVYVSLYMCVYMRAFIYVYICVVTGLDTVDAESLDLRTKTNSTHSLSSRISHSLTL